MKKSRKNLLIITILAVSILSVIYVQFNSHKLFGSKSDTPNIIIVLIDTLRTDHLSYNGYERLTSPNIDAFAKESLNFEYAYSGSSWTAPSVATLFTGVYPSVHGMMPPNARVKAAEKFSFKLGEDLYTLAEVLKDSGYSTYGVSSNEWISDRFGYTQGFDHFLVESRMNADLVNKKAYRMIDRIAQSSDPFFLYIHYFDPHDPYKPPRPFDTHFKEKSENNTQDKHLRKLILGYDNEIFFVDKKIGELFRYLKSKRLYQDTLIILTSDHGEQFNERGHIGHGFTLHNEEIKIPMLIRTPGQQIGKIVRDPVSHIDIYRTIAELVGSKISNAQMGISLLSNDLSKRPLGVISEVTRHYSYKALVRENFNKIIGEYEVTDGLYTPTGSERSMNVYDMVEDPLELTPLDPNGKGKESLACYLDVFERVGKEFPKYKVDSLEMSEDTLKELKTLGYL